MARRIKARHKNSFNPIYRVMGQKQRSVIYNTSYVAMNKLNEIIYYSPTIRDYINLTLKTSRAQINPTSETINKSKRVWQAHQSAIRTA